MPRHIGSKITFEELEKKFADLDVPEEQLAFYFEGDPSMSVRLRPGLRPDPKKVIMTENDRRTASRLHETKEEVVEGAMAFDWLNGYLTWRRQKRFLSKPDDGRPMLVFEGDSWFQFPLLLDDIVDVLLDRFGHVGWCMSSAGAELSEMVKGGGEYRGALDRFKDRWKVFLFSGAGNDIVGAKATGDGSVLEDIVAPFEQGKPARDYLKNDAYRRNMEGLRANYELILDDITGHYQGRPILLHGYAHAWPGGFDGDPRRVIYAAQDQWIGRYMRSEKLNIKDHILQHEIVTLMIDDFNDMLKSLCGGNNPRGKYKEAYHVDFRSLLTNVTDWNDELHPTDASFLKIGAAMDDMIRKVLATV
ncbi:hypothetical protein ABNQ39_36780 (plasmid) [Azospirillum sp. A26]|uniref:hypothetical protein n=1 Tax=Azospirillum sp. A26 TaxID=3160607 RepID=UPI003672ACAB